jgi:hypothetical protein
MESMMLDASGFQGSKDIIGSINEKLSELGSEGWEVNGDGGLFFILMSKQPGTKKQFEHHLSLYNENADSISILSLQGWDVKCRYLLGTIFSREKGNNKSEYEYYTEKNVPKIYNDKNEFEKNSQSAISFMNNLGNSGWELVYMEESSVFRKKKSGNVKWEYTLIHNDTVQSVISEINQLAEDGWQYSGTPISMHRSSYAEPVIMKKATGETIPQRYYRLQIIKSINLMSSGGSEALKKLEKLITGAYKNGWRFENILDMNKNYPGETGILFSAEEQCFIESPAPIIALYPKEDDKMLSKGAAEILAAELSRIPGVMIVERGIMDKILFEQKLSESGLVREDSKVRSGRIIQENTSILVDYNTENTETTLTIKGKEKTKVLKFKSIKIDVVDIVKAACEVNNSVK